jgi:toxin secretion/phage lysis holin
MRITICTAVGAAGGLIAGLFGGWDASLQALLIFMAVDYITGVITASVGKSPKSKSGSLCSAIGWKGLSKKGVVLLLVLVAQWLDVALSTSYIRDAVCISFMANELLSITENAGLIGVPLPDILKKAIEVLHDKNNNDD